MQETKVWRRFYRTWRRKWWRPWRRTWWRPWRRTWWRPWRRQVLFSVPSRPFLGCVPSFSRRRPVLFSAQSRPFLGTIPSLVLQAVVSLQMLFNKFPKSVTSTLIIKSLNSREGLSSIISVSPSRYSNCGGLCQKNSASTV